MGEGEHGPHLTQSRLGRGLPPCQVTASSIQPFGHNKDGPKVWGAPPPFGEGAEGSPSNTKSPGPRTSSIPSDILIYAAIQLQQIWAQKWGLCPFGGAGSPPNTMWLGPRPTCIPSGILIHETIWPQYTCVTDNRQTTSHDNSRTLHCNGRLKTTEPTEMPFGL